MKSRETIELIPNIEVHMKLTPLVLITSLMTAHLLLAEPPKLSIPAEVVAQPGAWVTVMPDTTAKTVTYISLSGLQPFPSSELKDGRKLIVNPTVRGRYDFTAVGSLNDEHAVTQFTIVVGNAPKPPPGPTPPEPGPDPPAPTPEPASKNPFGDEAPRVLILFDPSKALTVSEHSIIYGETARKALEEFCKGDYRIWTKDTVVEAPENLPWKSAMGKEKASYPWLMIGKGKQGYDGVLPNKSPQELADLLKKYQ